MTDVDLSPHVQNRPPADVIFKIHGDTLLAIRVGESATANVFEVTGETYNPRVLAQTDSAVVEGMVVTPRYQHDLRRVRTTHVMAGFVDKFPIDEMLDEPVLLLDRLPAPNMEDFS